MHRSATECHTSLSFPLKNINNWHEWSSLPIPNIELFIPRGCQRNEPFHSQEWSISNFPCSLTRNVTWRPGQMPNSSQLEPSYKIKTCTVILTISLIHFSLEGWENVLFELGSERVNCKLGSRWLELGVPFDQGLSPRPPWNRLKRTDGPLWGGFEREIPHKKRFQRLRDGIARLLGRPWHDRPSREVISKVEWSTGVSWRFTCPVQLSNRERPAKSSSTRIHCFHIVLLTETDYISRSFFLSLYDSFLKVEITWKQP